MQPLFDGKPVLTHSSVVTLNNCAQKYAWKHGRCIQKRGLERGRALSIGVLFHTGRDVYNKTGSEGGGCSAIGDAGMKGLGLGSDAMKGVERIAIARAMLRRSIERWPGLCKKSEVLFSIVRPRFTVRGKIDAIPGDGRVVDYKTVSNIEEFVESVQMLYQLDLYAAGCKKRGIDIDQIEYRIICRPTIKRYKAGKARKKEEAGVEYEKRCHEWLSGEKLATHAVFVNRGRTDRLWDWMQDAFERVCYHRIRDSWPQNVLACKQWNRRCQYKDLCLAQQNGDDVEWLINENYEGKPCHPELDDSSSRKPEALVAPASSCPALRGTPGPL